MSKTLQPRALESHDIPSRSRTLNNRKLLVTKKQLHLLINRTKGM